MIRFARSSRGRIGLLAASLLASGELLAALEARARFRPEVVEAGEAVLFEVTVSGDDRLPNGTPAFPENFALTVLQDHYTLRTSSRDSAQAWSQLTWKSFPTEAGTYAVGGQLTLDGETIEIKPATLRVEPERPWLRNQLELRFASPRQKPFAGEKMPAELELRVQADVAVMLPARPSVVANGVLVDPPGDFISRRPSDNWQLQKVFTWPTALRPTREGHHALRASLILRWEDPTPYTGNGAGRTSGYARREFVERLIRSEPLTLETRPLPFAAESFSGLIGQWDLQSDFDQTAIRADEPVRWIVRLEGLGAGATSGLRPELEHTEEWDISGPAVVSDKDGLRFEYLLSARSTGMQRLPTARLDVFDPAAESFKTLQTQLRSIPVAAAPLPPAPETAPGNASGRALPIVGGLAALALLSLGGAALWRRLRRATF